MVPYRGGRPVNGGILPLLLLSSTFGLALSFVPWPAAWKGLAAFAMAAVASLLIQIPRSLNDGFFVGLWLSVIMIAALAYLPVARTTPRAIAVGLYAGLWIGVGASVSGLRPNLLLALLPALVFLPGKWFTGRGYPIVIQVVASWMIAIASLSLFVSLMPTPGYKPDHMQ